jgi:hypothetical protein
LKDDPAFAASPAQRLTFFFERSPWYDVQNVGRYPVLGLDKTTLASLSDKQTCTAEERSTRAPHQAKIGN